MRVRDEEGKEVRYGYGTGTGTVHCIQYNMYHKRPLDAQNAQPIPMPGGGRSDRPLKERSDQAGSEGAAGHGDRGAILAGAAVSPPGPRRIIAQMLGACGIQTDRSQHYV